MYAHVTIPAVLIQWYSIRKHNQGHAKQVRPAVQQGETAQTTPPSC